MIFSILTIRGLAHQEQIPLKLVKFDYYSITSSNSTTLFSCLTLRAPNPAGTHDETFQNIAETSLTILTFARAGHRVHDRRQRCQRTVSGRGQLHADWQPRAEKVGLPLLDELRQEPARHGHHGSQHLRQGLWRSKPTDSGPGSANNGLYSSRQGSQTFNFIFWTNCMCFWADPRI